jgi:hypothetical protein
MYQPTPEDVVMLRLLLPGGEYPSNCFKHKDALYYSSEDAVFIVTKQQPSKYRYNVYTELAIWALEEIRLLGALTLSLPEDSGVALVPFPASMDAPVPLSADLSADNVILSCLEFVTERVLPDSEGSGIFSDSLSIINYPEYDTMKDLFESIDPSDGVLVRGLYTLMKSQFLINQGSCLFPINIGSRFFMEEAFINLQISREAALQKIREHLRSLGNPNPSFRQAHNYIGSNLQMGKSFLKRLELQHEAWIETKHPTSIYGTEWAPTLSSDDVLEMYGPLISIYRHIVLAHD